MQIYANFKNLDSILKKLSPQQMYGALEFAFSDTLMLSEYIAKTFVPVKRGELRSSITQQYDGNLRGRIGTNLHYAPYPQFGTGIYGPLGRRIVPRKAKVFYNKYTGKYYGRSISGQRPQEYFTKAFNKLKTEAPKNFSQRVMEKLGGSMP